jgi:hypothetical protein
MRRLDMLYLTREKAMNPLLRRLAGLGLVVLGLGPMIAVVGGVALVVVLCVDTVRTAGQKIAGIAAIVGGEIVPQVQKVQASYATLATQAEHMKAELDKAMLAVTQIQDFQIQPGQFGSTGSLHLHIPDRNLSFASGAVRINDGELFNQTVPGVQIPPRAVAMPMAPLRAAFAPFGPNGPVGQAIGSSQRVLEATLGEVTKLQQPLQEIEKTVLDGLAPLRAVVAWIAMIVAATLAALGVLLAIYVLAGILLIIYRPREARMAFGTGGVVGFVAFIYRMLLLEGTSRLLGRTPPRSPEQSIAELEGMVARLETELVTLRSEFAGQQAPAIT